MMGGLYGLYGGVSHVEMLSRFLTPREEGGLLLLLFTAKPQTQPWFGGLDAESFFFFLLIWTANYRLIRLKRMYCTMGRSLLYRSNY